MKKVHLSLLGLCLCTFLSAQQLFLEAFSGMNRTAFDSEIYPEQDWYAPIGIRIAGGAEHVQIGGEYHQSLSGAILNFKNDSREEVESSYYGGFLRANLGRYPAFGFGIILKIGAGMYDNTHSVFDQSGNSEANVSYEYDPEFGMNGGIGVSIPIPNTMHLEIGYVYNYVDRPELDAIQGFKAHYHSIQAGLSWNFVFGDKAKRNKHLKDNWKWRQGWRG